jgi:hypothetical protein
MRDIISKEGITVQCAQSQHLWQFMLMTFREDYGNNNNNDKNIIYKVATKDLPYSLQN